MIMPCINCTSASDCGGSLALVVGGSVRVGCPGAPGWTTTGVGPDCCAKSEGNESVIVLATRSAVGANLITERSLGLTIDVMMPKGSRLGFTLPQSGTGSGGVSPGI